MYKKIALVTIFLMIVLFTYGLASLPLLSHDYRYTPPRVDAYLSAFNVTAHEPITNGLGIPLNQNITTTFTAELNAITVSPMTFAAHTSFGGLLTSDLTIVSNTIILNPNRDLFMGERVQIIATDNLQSSLGENLLNPTQWGFNAGVNVPRCQAGFTNINANLQDAFGGSADWADYDNDGDLDILLTGFSDEGFSLSWVYRNNNGVFTNINAGIPGIDQSSADWGDFDNDGDLDILLAGTPNSGRLTRVYRNNNGVFTNMLLPLTPVNLSSVAWGDYDNDGDLDILVTGNSASGDVTHIYRNDGILNFVNVNAGLPGISLGSASWGDYDNDGYLDILLTGASGTGQITRIYRNDGGTGSFTNINAGLPSLIFSDASWGDYDNDGYLDILLTGQSGGRVSRIFRNNGGTGSFTNIGANVTDVAQGSTAWGDYDNDGDLDILITGDNGNRVAIVYRNDGGTFVNSGAILTGVTASDVAWGDYDNDGDLDILLVGQDGSGVSVSQIYRNDDCTFVISDREPLPQAIGVAVNTDITATFAGYPEASSVDNDSFVLHTAYSGWLTGTFVITGEAVTLNPSRDFFAGEQIQIMATNAIKNTRNVGLATRSQWSFIAGSTNSRCVDIFTDSGTVDDFLSPVKDGDVAWGDYDNDGDLDILVTGLDGTNSRIAKIYRNDLGSFVDSGSADDILEPVFHSSVAWGDYDNDGDLDILLTGLDGTNNEVAKIYRNDDGIFADSGLVDNALLPVFAGSVAWGDIENDGDLDILLTGLNISTPVAKIYRNINGVFFGSGIIDDALVGVFSSSVAWGDYDNDGDLDILLTGLDNTVSVAKIYRNNGIFVDSGVVDDDLAAVEDGSVAWGDYDNDGDLDILITGRDSTLTPLSKIYRNEANTFVDSGIIDDALTFVRESSVAWGDYDNDGDLDILLTGRDTDNSSVAKIYLNQNGIFTDSGAIDDDLIAVDKGAVAWSDYDNDGDLDILVTGRNIATNTVVSKIYRNEDCAPLLLDIALSNNDVLLSWNESQATCVFNIHEANEPYNPPVGASYTNQTSGTILPTTGDAGQNFYYTVVALCGDGQISSNEVAEFDFSLQSGN
ncbi:MAG TPA: FG-GAP-like repeat-containing protein [Anaerolineae bacterium]|nr:FG-GAP-like repeat-containing protein [Anaerolineae bacterium]